MVTKGGGASSLPRVLMGFVVFRKRVKTRTSFYSLYCACSRGIGSFPPSHPLSLVAEGSHGICSFWKAREDLWRTLSTPLPSSLCTAHAPGELVRFFPRPTVAMETGTHGRRPRSIATVG